MIETSLVKQYNLFIESQLKLGKCFIHTGNVDCDNPFKEFTKFELLNFIYNDNERNNTLSSLKDKPDLNQYRGWVSPDYVKTKEFCVSTNYWDPIKYNRLDLEPYINGWHVIDNNTLQILKQLEKNRHLLKQLNQKWTLEELTKEAFKPSRISYIFSIDPEYEF